MHATIIRWVSDDPFPGLVELLLRDGAGKVWIFVDKYPMFLQEGSLGPENDYPVSVEIAGTVIGQADDQVIVSTAEPWGIETVDGTYEFIMQETQLIHQG
jgi:hypothetical protein